MTKNPTPTQKQEGLGPQGRYHPRMYIRLVASTELTTVGCIQYIYFMLGE